MNLPTRILKREKKAISNSAQALASDQAFVHGEQIGPMPFAQGHAIKVSVAPT
jgi:hypothetical protein